jgi:hypothetical protein
VYIFERCLLNLKGLLACTLCNVASTIRASQISFRKPNISSPPQGITRVKYPCVHEGTDGRISVGTRPRPRFTPRGFHFSWCIVAQFPGAGYSDAYIRSLYEHCGLVFFYVFTFANHFVSMLISASTEFLLLSYSRFVSATPTKGSSDTARRDVRSAVTNSTRSSIRPSAPSTIPTHHLNCTDVRYTSR